VLRARPAPVPLLALPCGAMSYNIRAVTVGAVQNLEHHEATLSCWGCSPSLPPLKGSRSTPLEHLPQGKGRLRDGAFDPCSTFVEFFKLFGLLSLPRRSQRYLLGFGVGGHTSR